MKFAVITDPDYCVYIEPVDFGHFVHADVRRWSRAVQKRLAGDFEVFQRLYKKELYAAHFPDDHESGKKHLKFLKMYGFKLWRLATNYEGRECSLFVKEYNDG